MRIEENIMNLMERRKLKRFSLELPIWIFAEDENGNEKTIDGITSNICSGGAFLKVTALLPVGTIVYIKIFLSFKDLNTFGSKGSYIDVPGHVIRAKDNRMAITFDKRCKINPLIPE